MGSKSSSHSSELQDGILIPIRGQRSIRERQKAPTPSPPFLASLQSKQEAQGLFTNQLVSTWKKIIAFTGFNPVPTPPRARESIDIDESSSLFYIENFLKNILLVFMVMMKISSNKGRRKKIGILYDLVLTKKSAKQYFLVSLISGEGHRFRTKS